MATTGPKISSCAMVIFGIRIRKNRRFVEPTARQIAGFRAVPAGDQSCALAFPDLDILHHRLQLRLIHHGPDIRIRIEPVAQFERPCPLRKAIEKFPVDFRVDRNAAGSRAALPAGSKAAPHRAFHGEFQVGVVHHDHNILAAHFEVARLERGAHA